MRAIVDDPERDAALRGWIEAIGGSCVTGVQRIGGGAFRSSARILLRTADGADAALFVKVDLGSAPRTPFDLQREYRVLDALAGRAHAPRAIAYDGELMAMAMQCLSGTADYARIAEGRRGRLERSFVSALAETHRVALASLALDHLPPDLGIGEAIAADLQLWRDLLLDSVPDPDPITLFALAWCAARVPADDRPAVLVQGDAGPGNFLFDGDRITGLVDWEMAHIGHPLEDLGCVLARSLVQPMAGADRLLALYREASGTDWTKAELIHATILTMTRFSVPITMALGSRHTGLDLGLTDGYFRMSQISLLRLIAVAERLMLDETVPERGARPRIGFELNYLRSVLGTIVRPAVADDYARYRLDGAVGLLGYLGAALVDEDHHAPADPVATLATNRALIEAGGEPLRGAVQALLREALYRERLMRDMLGPLHGRRIAI